MRNKIQFPREVLLFEVERRCGDPACNARVRLGLTKAEARAYTGFVCERCERWTDDLLLERDIPEWWEELKVTALDGIRPVPLEKREAGLPPDSVARLSEAWRHLDAHKRAGGTEDESGGDKSS